MATKKTSKTSINKVIEDLNKEHGSGTVFTMQDDNISMDTERIPTGVAAVDQILGGGLPVGRFVDMYGPQGSGKTSIALSFIAQAQKHGTCVFIDLENAFDPRMAESSGVDLSTLIISQPSSAESTFDIIRKFALTGDCSAIVVDSFAGVVPAAELVGEFGDAHVGLVGRLTSQALRILTKEMPKVDSKTIIVFINQLRANIGGSAWGPSKEPTGGNAIKFYASTRMKVSRTKNITQSSSVVGHEVQVITEKNKLAPPYQKTTFEIYYDTGISNESTILDAAIDRGLINTAGGGWMTDTRTGEKLGQGRPNVLSYMAEHSDFVEELNNDLLTTQ